MDFNRLEEKWQKKWEKAKLFEANPSKEKKFFLTVPYPYVSGPYHIGHGRAYVGGDIFARFQRAQGKNVLFPMAGHITGTPVLAISNAIKRGEKKTIDLMKDYVSVHESDAKKIEKIVESFKEPWNVYEYFSEKMKKDFGSIGIGIDWRRKFSSGDKEYNKFIEWQYFKLKEFGALTQGDYPILYCLNDNNAVGEDDISGGDTNKVSINEFTLLKFRLDDSYLVAGTLRVETMFGQTNLWVNPETDYWKAIVERENWIASKEFFEKLELQGKVVQKIGIVKGKELIGKKAIAPIIEREIIILPASLCDADIATGIVTSVPSDAPYDWIALKELHESEKKCKEFGLNWNEIKKIQPIPIIDTPGYGDLPGKEICEKNNIHSLSQIEELEKATNEIYKAGYFSGKMKAIAGKFAGWEVQKAKDAVRAELIAEKKADVFFETSRKANCRCGGKVIVAKLKGQWFLDYNTRGWKDKAKKCLGQMEIFPEKYRKVFEETIDWLDKRPCVRKRGLGTQFPFDKDWVIESLSDSTIYMAFYTIAHTIHKNKIKPEQLIPEVFDFVFLGKKTAKLKDSKIPQKVLDEMQKEFFYWYPLDQRHTAVMHISNHLSFFIFHHVAIFPEKHWPKKITLIEPMIAEGAKISKSKGNVIPLAEVSEKFGADTFRLYMAYSAEFGTKMDWKESEVINAKKQLERFYSMLENNSKLKEGKAQSVQAKAFQSMFEKKLLEARKELNENNLRKFVQIVFFDLNNLVLDGNRFIPEKEKGAMKNYLNKWLIVLSSVAPHLCEELWEKNKNKGFCSQQEWPEVEKGKICEESEQLMELIKQIFSDFEAVKKLSRIEKPKKLKLIIAGQWKFDLLKKLSKELEKTKNVKELIDRTKIAGKEKETANIIVMAVKNPERIPKNILSQNKEFSALNENKKLLEKELNCAIEIELEEKSKIEKARNAFPQKPAIVIE